MTTCSDSESHQEIPEYVTTSIGRVEVGNIANRLRDVAAVLAAQGLTEAAEHIARACGALLGENAPGALSSGRNGLNGTNGTSKPAPLVSASSQP